MSESPGHPDDDSSVTRGTPGRDVTGPGPAGSNNLDAAPDAPSDDSHTNTETPPAPVKGDLASGSHPIKAEHEVVDELQHDVDPDFSLEATLRNVQQERIQLNHKEKKLDVAWKDLYVRGVGASVLYGQTVSSMFNPLSSLQDKRRAGALQARAAKLDVNIASPSTSTNANANVPPLGKNERFLIQGFSGVVKAGEMALVLGRPGSGCTTFLKAIANLNAGVASVDGEVIYGDMSAEEAKKYPGQIVFNSEDECHYPTLTVQETLDFALKMKTPHTRLQGVSRKDYKTTFFEGVIRMFGIEHTRDTLVGDEFIRGVSGGERKRVSLAEVIVNQATVTVWDSPSRGLDASTALEFTRSIRTITDIIGCTTFVTLYQAGNQMYELFDKVLVIAAGQCIYWGPLKEARPYFERMGFICSPGQNVSDYLTGVTVLTERIIADDIKHDPAKRHQVPRTIADFVDAYHESDIARRMAQELEDHLKETERRRLQTEDFKVGVREDKAKSVPKNDPFTAGLWTQIKAAATRQYQLMWNDKASLAIKQGSSIVQSIILGSVFYMLPQTTGGIFTRGGTIFFCLLFNALLSMSEVTQSFHGRSIMAKHKSFAMYRPSAVVFAQVLADLPVLVLQISLFMFPIYFMSQLKQTASAFFTLWVIIYVTTLCMIAFFRLVGFSFNTFDGASGVSGISLGLLILYAGYILPQTSMQDWLSWIRWLNPVYYGFESAMVNEFHDAEFECVTIVPSGGPYTTTGNNFACAVAGAVPGSTTVNGDAYLKAALNYEHSHLWRNVGIVVVFWVAFVLLTAISVEHLRAAGASKSYLLYSRGALRKDDDIDPQDEEQGGIRREKSRAVTTASGEKVMPRLEFHQADTIFTWRHIGYSVHVKDGMRKLLNEVQGYARPGSLLALMGSSGAGKSTLLDTLSLRKYEGVVEGEIMIDGRPPGASFQRTTAYVAQMDVHDPTQTVREALVFSALLRQPRDTPEIEKLAYVDTVMDILELHDIADALIGVPGAGLGVEQRKRVTIGVELVSKPALLFLDEPTSGLDGQSSFKIVQFLRKLADAGQCIICTIHQPSALLFSQFDQLLLLAKGGNTVYMGPLGTNGQTMIDYFEKNGIECPKDCNPAEFMIDVVSGSLSKGRDWASIWAESPEHEAVTQRLDALIEDCKNKPPTFTEDGLEYATTTATQLRLVTARANRAIWRSPPYIRARLALIIGSSLINSLSFLQIDNSVTSLQNRLFSIFQGMFIAPGILAQVQPHFIHNRNVFEAREKLSKMYGWFPFVVSEIVAEMPWIVVSVVIYYCLWYFVVFPVGISTNPYHAGPMFAMILLMHIFNLAFGQAIAAFSGNEQQATLINPLFLGVFATFSGVLVPFGQITAFWRDWMYYLNPWTYSLGGQVFFSMRDIPVVCAEKEYARFPPPAGQTCGQYLAPFLSMTSGYIRDPSATDECQYCVYSTGNDYLKRVNLDNAVDGPRDIGITALYMVACFFILFAAMWSRSRPKNVRKP